MKPELPELPYRFNELEPHISARTLQFHYDRHHRGYLEKLGGLIDGTPLENLELSDLVTSTRGEVYDNAAQVYNHTFYWNSMTPGGGREPRGRIGQAIVSSFGSWATFEKEFAERALGLFGSGYVWITFDPELQCVTIDAMKDAGCPLQVQRIPLLAMDVWEHAYYLDYQNERPRYVKAFLSSLANWEFAEANLPSHEE